MNTFDVTNPQVVAGAFARGFLGLSPDKLAHELSSAYTKAVECSKADDSALSVKLGPKELDEYALLVASFQSALSRVESIKTTCGEHIFARKEMVPFIANLMAWQHVLSTFRSLNG